jgi:hypothetical protein
MRQVKNFLDLLITVMIEARQRQADAYLKGLTYNG